MTETWVVNASPVIVLAKVGQLRLLDALADPLILPDPVAVEILAGPAGDAARATVESGWGRREALTHLPDSVLEWGLGAGESAVLALSMERRPAVAVLDDASARAAARALGVPVIGTLGVVVRARMRGLLPAAAPVMADLRTAGLYLDDAIVRAALQRVGELWQP